MSMWKTFATDQTVPGLDLELHEGCQEPTAAALQVRAVVSCHPELAASVISAKEMED